MQGVLTRPHDSDFAAENWQLQTRFWHPVAFTSEITDKPSPFVLLGLRLIAFRTNSGFTVALDRCHSCAHRGNCERSTSIGATPSARTKKAMLGRLRRSTSSLTRIDRRMAFE